MASFCSAIAIYLGADLFDRNRVGGKGVDQIANRLGIDVSERLVVSALTGRELALGLRGVQELVPIPGSPAPLETW
jgi:hypothetical protein